MSSQCRKRSGRKQHLEQDRGTMGVLALRIDFQLRSQSIFVALVGMPHVIVGRLELARADRRMIQGSR